MTHFSIRRFDQILDDVRFARAWYSRIGISTRATRLELIEEKTSELLRDLNSLPPEMVVERWSNPDTYYVLTDGAGFGSIAREIGKVGPNLLPKRSLRTVLEGPLSPRDEVLGDASVNARNVFTELELAAYFSAKGIPPIRFDDLRFRFGGTQFAVQCKRLHSRSRVGNNVDDAYNQLKRDLVTDHDRGFIALAIEKVMGIERRPPFPVEQETDLTHEVLRLAEEFRAAFGHSWRKFVDPRVTAMLIIVRLLCHTVTHNVIGPAYYIDLLNLASAEALQATDLARLRQLVSCLQISADQGTTRG